MIQKKLFSLSFIFLFILIFQVQCKKTPTSPDVEEYTKPVIWVDTFELSFMAKESGDNPGFQTISIKNSGQKTLEYTLSVNADWLSVEPDKGSSSGEKVKHTVKVKKKGLTAREDEYKAVISIDSSNAYNSPQKVEVGFKLAKNFPPKIRANPQSLSFNAAEGKASSVSKSLNIENSGEGTLDYLITCSPSWLTVNPNKGRLKGGRNTHTVSVDAEKLDSGTYSGKIVVKDPDAANNPQEIEVSVNISEKQPPQIWASPPSLSFSAVAGHSNPASQNLDIKNAGEGTLDYTLNSDSAWLSVRPQSGRSNGGKNTHTVSVDIGGMSNGIHKGKITIKDTDASNNPQRVDVTLNISEEQAPQIWVSQQNFSFSAQEGSSSPASKILSIKNSGGGTLRYSISSNSSWLYVNPGEGTSNGGKKDHTISVDIQGLNAGSYNGILSVIDSEASNSPFAVKVNLTINSKVSDNKISISCDPGSGGTNTIVEIPVSIYGNAEEISDFGLELTFDSSIFAYHSIEKGSLSSSWAYIDGNEISSGKVKVGGFGGTAAISKGSSGTIAVVKLKVTSAASSDSQTQIAIQSYIDGIAGMRPEPASVKFTYKK